VKPVVDGLVSKYAGRYDLKVVNLSRGVAADRQLYESFGLEYVPTFVFLNTDGSVSGKIVGSASVADIEAELAKLK
jgi:hypothetical protein